MIFTEDRELPRADIERFQSIIDGTSPWPSDNDTIEVLTVDFGYGWEIDINIVNGEPTPFVDVMLFHDGSEVYAWEISERVTGEWAVVLGEDINRAFRLQVFAKLERDET